MSEKHALVRIAEKLVKEGILCDDNSLCTIKQSDEWGSPAKRNHNSSIRNILNESVLNCYTRSLTETDFERKSKWRDVFRKLEDGPGLHKKTFKYHCSLKGRAAMKEYYRQLVYVTLKTWVHAAICRAVAPFVPELRNYRCFSFSGETTLSDPEKTVAGMTKTSEPGALFETWCKADITGTRKYRSDADRDKQLKNNKSLYVYRYAGPAYPYDFDPSRDPEAMKLMNRMAGTIPRQSYLETSWMANIIVNELMTKIPRRQWVRLFNDSEWFWGHGRVMSFPIEMGKVVPEDSSAIFSPEHITEEVPEQDHTPTGFVYDYNTALHLVTSVDCLRELVTMCCLGKVVSTPEERKMIKTTVFTPKIINSQTERQARVVFNKIGKVQKMKLRDGTKKRLKKYEDLVASDKIQWRFFVRLVQMLKLPDNCTMAEVY